MVKGMLAKVFRLQDEVVQDASRSKIVIHTQPMGSAGTASYAGYPSEEYLQTLQGTARADVYDKMRRSDPQVKMLLKATKDPIKSATWEVEPGEANNPEAQLDADFIKHILFNDMEKPWEQFLSEALGVVDFGHSVFEMIDKVVLDHPKFGSYNGIKALGFRSQRTIERWNLNPDTDQLQSVSQYAYGDLSKTVDIPADFLLVFSLDKEGANYEGISALRCCYGNYFRKNHYLKMNSIGIEKFAIPTPVVTIPVGKESGEQFDNMVSVLENYMLHEKNYITKPDGWVIDFNTNTYDPQKVESSIDGEDKRMTKAFLANFLELGISGFGSQSLSFDLSDFFLNSLDHIAGIITGEVNRVLIPRLIQLNRGPRACYPKLKHSGISDRAGKELMEVVGGFVEKGVITADDVLETHMRKRFKLPEADTLTKRAKPQQHYQAYSLMERVKEMRKSRGI